MTNCMVQEMWVADFAFSCLRDLPVEWRAIVRAVINAVSLSEEVALMADPTTHKNGLQDGHNGVSRLMFFRVLKGKR